MTLTAPRFSLPTVQLFAHFPSELTSRRDYVPPLFVSLLPSASKDGRRAHPPVGSVGSLLASITTVGSREQVLFLFVLPQFHLPKGKKNETLESTAKLSPWSCHTCRRTMGGRELASDIPPHTKPQLLVSVKRQSLDLAKTGRAGPRFVLRSPDSAQSYLTVFPRNQVVGLVPSERLYKVEVSPVLWPL